jgi:hypothetical protein
MIMRDDRVFQGTPVQIVRAMKEIAFRVQHVNLTLVDEMIRAGFARRA